MSKTQDSTTASTTSPPMTEITVPPFGANFSTLVSPWSVVPVTSPPVGSVVPFQPMLGSMVATESDVETTPFRDLDVTRSESSLRRFLHGLPGVDQVGAEQRAASLSTRSIKTSAKAYALDLAISMVDLTTLEGQDTEGKVRSLAAKAMHPDPSDPSCPSTAAVCVYPDMVATVKDALGSSGVKVAAVATAFPSGRAAMDIKLADTKDAVDAGADEIDMVIDRGAFLAGRYLEIYEEIAQIREAVRQRAPQGDPRDR